MCLGSHEAHRMLPLRPGVGNRVCLPGAQEVTVEEVVGQFIGADADGGRVRSDYPLLLLHARVSVRCTSAADGGAEPAAADDARELGEHLERLLGLCDSDDEKMIRNAQG